MQNTEDEAVDFTMLHTVHECVSKPRSLTHRMIPFLVAEVRSGSVKWHFDYTVSSELHN
jgi:hypothetical protein